MEWPSQNWRQIFLLLALYMKGCHFSLRAVCDFSLQEEQQVIQQQAIVEDIATAEASHLRRPHCCGSRGIVEATLSGGCGTVEEAVEAVVLWRPHCCGAPVFGEDSKTETTGLFTRVGMSGPRANMSGSPHPVWRSLVKADCTRAPQAGHAAMDRTCWGQLASLLARLCLLSPFSSHSLPLVFPS